MYLTLYDVEQMKEFHNDICLCEYYPKSNQTANGVVIPAVWSQAHNGYILNEVFSKIPLVYADCANCYSIEKNQDILYTFEEYKSCVDNLINGLNNIYLGRYRFRNKDIYQMYDHYKRIHQSGMWVAGLVNMVADVQLATASELNPIIPSEGLVTVLGFNTYVKSVAELVPNLNLDLFTALHMYKKYRVEIENTTDAGEEIPFILSNSLQTISAVVSQLTPEIAANDMENILSGQTSDVALLNYYQAMLTNYGVRERVAKALLTYKDYRLQKTIHNIVVRNAGIDTNREIVLFPKNSVAVQNNGGSDIFSKTLF